MRGGGGGRGGEEEEVVIINPNALPNSSSSFSSFMNNGSHRGNFGRKSRECGRLQFKRCHIPKIGLVEIRLMNQKWSCQNFFR